MAEGSLKSILTAGGRGGRLRAGQPVAIVSVASQWHQDTCCQESSVDHHQRVIRHRSPQKGAQHDLTVAVGSELGGRQDVRTQCHQCGYTHRRITAVTAVSTRTTEMGSILRRVGHAKGGTVGAIKCQATPCMLACTFVAPLLSTHFEDLLQRVGTDAGSRFCNGARNHGSPRSR